MRPRLTLVTVLIAISLPGFGIVNDAELAQLADRAMSAPVDQQARLYTEVAERELRYADELYTADDVTKARAAIGDVVRYADQASDAAIKTGKRLKDTEIAMRKMSVKLRDMKRKLTFEDQPPLQSASDHLETLRTSLLSHMFKGKK
jgi:hypothetical protein